MKMPAFTLDRSARVWHRLWSVRFALLSALVMTLQQVLPLWQPALRDVPYAAIATVLALLSSVSRVVHQPAARDALDAAQGRPPC